MMLSSSLFFPFQSEQKVAIVLRPMCSTFLRLGIRYRCLNSVFAKSLSLLNLRRMYVETNLDRDYDDQMTYLMMHLRNYCPMYHCSQSMTIFSGNTILDEFGTDVSTLFEKSNFCPKNSILTKLQFFSGNQSCQQLKRANPSIFTSFHPKFF